MFVKMKKEEYYLGKKVSELNIHEKRFRECMRLMRVHKMLEQAEKMHKTLSKDGLTPALPSPLLRS